MFNDDDDEDMLDSIYSDGTWEWDDKKNELKFVSFVPQSAPKSNLPQISAKIVGPIVFKDDMDIIEQQKFRKRIQRKIEGDSDIVTLQDIKDIVLYTAPPSLLTPMIINVLHSSITERFLRALILYCQYYSQIVNIMVNRTSDLEKKIRLSNSDKIESGFQENLMDLRVLITKEYCSMIIGVGDFKKFHHKGKAKKMQSMSKREAMVFEPLIVLSVQIVWIALARKNYQQIELEVNRLIRSKTFNVVEHRKKIAAESKMSEVERKVLRGPCLRSVHPLLLHSPLLDEIRCFRDVDFRLLGLGVLNMQGLNERLQHLEHYLALEESKFQEKGISLGIIGLDRNRFDTMLNEVQKEEKRSSRLSAQGSRNISRRSILRATSTASRASTAFNKSTPYLRQPIFREIILSENKTEPQPLEFPLQTSPPLQVNQEQRRRWIMRVSRLGT